MLSLVLRFGFSLWWYPVRPSKTCNTSCTTPFKFGHTSRIYRLVITRNSNIAIMSILPHLPSIVLAIAGNVFFACRNATIVDLGGNFLLDVRWAVVSCRRNPAMSDSAFVVLHLFAADAHDFAFFLVLFLTSFFHSSRVNPLIVSPSCNTDWSAAFSVSGVLIGTIEAGPFSLSGRISYRFSMQN